MTKTPTQPSSTHVTSAACKPDLNVILFGETGVGKSSLVNLIAGKKVTNTSNDLGVCTMSYAPYSFRVQGVCYTIWDTRGLGEPEAEVGVQGYLAAVKQANELIQSLTDKGGVDLLVLCHKGHITQTTRSNYRLFYEVLCGGNVPIALAATFLERCARMEDWWSKNSDLFKEKGMSFAAHACVTGLPDHAKSAESKHAIEKMLGQHDKQKRYNMPREVWIRRFAQRWVRPNGLKEVDLQEFLCKRCGFSRRDAHEIAGVILAKSPETHNSNDSKEQPDSSRRSHQGTST